MKKYETAIIIPVYNQWQFTRACLKSLKATISSRNIQIIVIDNASSDPTPAGAPVLGKSLFGNDFIYHRFEKNINFGPASNFGAQLANSDYLLFLNNDTQTLPGWYDPLLQDFKQFPNLAGAGPLLLYPGEGPFGQAVQHLGVYISPLKKVSHLYSGIPAASPLAGKRRFFQAITAACIMMPGKIFQAAGGFYEGYANGFEDVDLCARLSAEGLRFTVNPQAQVLHYESQSTGRSARETANSQLFKERAQKLLKPDWHLYVKADELVPTVNDWQVITPGLTSGLQNDLNHASAGLNFEDLKSLLIENPFWQSGWNKLRSQITDSELMAAVTLFQCGLLPDPAPALDNLEFDLDRDNTDHLLQWDARIALFSAPFAKYQEYAREKISACFQNGAPEMGKLYSQWLAKSEQIKMEVYNPFMARLRKTVPCVKKLIQKIKVGSSTL